MEECGVLFPHPRRVVRVAGFVQAAQCALAPGSVWKCGGSPVKEFSAD